MISGDFHGDFHGDFKIAMGKSPVLIGKSTIKWLFETTNQVWPVSPFATALRSRRTRCLVDGSSSGNDKHLRPPEALDLQI